MNKPEINHGHRRMHRAVRKRALRRERREDERSIWQNLSMIGALGWLIVTPILMGILAGRWLDRTFDTGVFFSGALIFVGVVAGCALARAFGGAGDGAGCRPRLLRRCASRTSFPSSGCHRAA